LEPGAAQLSRTTSEGYTSRNNGGIIETISYLVKRPPSVPF